MIEYKPDEVNLKYQPIFTILCDRDNDDKYSDEKIDRLYNTLLRWIYKDKKILRNN